MIRVLRTVLLFCAIVLVSFATKAQYFPSTSYNVSKISRVSFTYSKSSDGNKYRAEVPPWIIPGGYRSYFFVDGNDSYVWSSQASMADKSSISLDDAIGPFQTSSSYTHERDFSIFKNVQNWKRNYHAIYTAQYINHPVVGPVSLAFLHGENKNEVAAYENYQNTIQPNVPINLQNPNTYSGGTPFHDGWDAYNAIISAAWVPNTRGSNWGQQFFDNDLGPIVWPSTGYVTHSGVKCTTGLRHPSSIVADGYVYVFYAEGGPYGNNIPEEEGRKEGIKVTRAKIADALNPYGYYTYYRDPSGVESWLPSLPDGFTKERMLDFVAFKGPKSTDLMNDAKNAFQEIRFSVAKVRNTDYFIGIEQYIDLADAKKYKVAIRFSSDLLHWTNRTLIVYAAEDWSHSKINYPIFLDRGGWSNNEVDIDDFYILGTETQPEHYVNRIHIIKAFGPSGQTTPLTFFATQSFPANVIYPNPTNGSFQVALNVSNPTNLRIDIFGMDGKILQNVVNEQREKGRYIDQYDLSAYPAGTYLVAIIQNDQRRTYKLVKN